MALRRARAQGEVELAEVAALPGRAQGLGEVHDPSLPGEDLSAFVMNVLMPSRGPHRGSHVSIVRGTGLPVFLAYRGFVLVGMGAAVSRVLLPAQIDDYGIDKATIGLTFFTFSAGFMLAGAVSGKLLHRLGTRLTLAAGSGVFGGRGPDHRRPPVVRTPWLQVWPASAPASWRRCSTRTSPRCRRRPP